MSGVPEVRAALILALWVGIAPFWAAASTVNSRPTAIVRDASTGRLYYEVCQGGIGPGGGAAILHGDRGGNRGAACPSCSEPCTLAGPLTLAEWCSALRALPVPAGASQAQVGDFLRGFQERGVCP
jgi:hypothetical protein